MIYVHYILFTVYNQGSSGRATGATAMNAQSSRSHCIFTLTLSQMNDDGFVYF